ncbi:sphingomyelin phosphodiesterase 3-like, partial [Saccoglossus kowalevskii]
MAPYETPFDSRCLNALYRLSWLLIQPCYWSLNRMISCCVSTSGDLSTRGEDPCYERFVYLVVLIPTYLIIFLIFTPTALLGLCSWIILQRYRHPFIYSYYESQCILEDWTDISTRQCFRIGSANISLLPEAIARMNNLECTYWRAKEMAHRLANSQLRPRPKIFIESPSDNELARSSSLYNHMQNHYQYSDVVLTNMENHTSKVHSPDCEDVHIVYNSGYTNNHINGTNSTVRNGGIVKNSQTYDSIRSDTTQDSAYVVNSRMKKSPSAPSMPDGIRQPSRSSTHSEFQGSDFMPMDSNPSISLNACGLSLSEDQSNGDFSPTLAKEDSRTFNEGFSRCQHSVEINFPSQIDFMCFQEVYEPSSAKAFIKKIHPWFSHIIYDVGINSWDSNLFMLNSGLVVASRYPILDADFKYFTHCAREDKAICKGLLMTKVRLGKTRDRQRIVGYIAVTQLQAGRDKSFIRLNQMNKITLWLQEFKKKTLCVSDPEDIIAFDVLTGDFNFDNMSP